MFNEEILYKDRDKKVESERDENVDKEQLEASQLTSLQDNLVAHSIIALLVISR